MRCEMFVWTMKRDARTQRCEVSGEIKAPEL